MNNNKETKNRKKSVVVVSVLAACFVVGGIFAGLTLTTDSDAKESNKVTTNETKVVKEAEKKTAEKKDVEKNSTAEEKNGANKAQKAENKTDSPANKNNSTSNSSSSAAKPSNGNGNNSSKPTVHKHNYVAKQRVEYEERTVYGNKCNHCGYTSQTNSIETHIDTNFMNGCRSYSTGVAIGSETVPVTYTYYECSCGDWHY